MRSSSIVDRSRDVGSDGSALNVSAPLSLRQSSMRSISAGSTANRRCLACVNTQRKLSFWRLLNTRVWKIIFICFTIILLFGAQVRDLLVPAVSDPEALDTAFDYINIVVLVYFCVDIIMRVDAEPNYFQLHLFGCCDYFSGYVNHDSASETLGAASFTLCGKSIPCHIGSFLFWCDTIATMLLLREISLVGWGNKFDEGYISIVLAESGLMHSIKGRGLVNDPSPAEYSDVNVLVIVAKCMRAARFIRSSAAVKIAGKFNVGILLNFLNPFYWCGMSRRKKNNHPSPNGSNALGTSNRRRGWNSMNNHKAFRGSGVSGSSRYGILGAFQWMGILKDDKEELRRQIAATKIQRAWRRLRQRSRDYDGYESHDDDAAWKGRGSYNMERAIKKRSDQRQSGGSGIGDDSERSQTESRRRNESQVGSAMRALTGKRVASGIIVALIATVLFTYNEFSATRPTTMIVLHSQTQVDAFAEKSLQAARMSSVPDLFEYKLANGTTLVLDKNITNLRPRERLRVEVEDYGGQRTVGYFSFREEKIESAFVQILCTIFVLLVWFFGVTSFAGPVMILVVIPIERMVRLLKMLMLDPLGYQSTARYKRFVAEEDQITRNTQWTKDVLKGMETSFLMSTILRIGSLMKVGFGSAGVEIIRNNLQRGQDNNTVMLSEQGSTVSCIFLFCDIRQFTDATECLQEEVFVFTNRIAAVVHSICHAYGGSANKNIGDAFLCSWLLDECDGSGDDAFLDGKENDFTAKHNQADKALLSVVKICTALHHDEYYVETMSEIAKEALLTKLSKRDGPIVQMGFGLHAGKAVQGAIGSQRKIDATYVSEAVERAEYLEASTKKYGLKMLMSDDFHRLLHPSNRRRCRKIDQILLRSEEDEEDDEGLPEGHVIELLTFDMDIEALWRDTKHGAKSSRSDGGRESDSDLGSEKGVRRDPRGGNRPSAGLKAMSRRRSVMFSKDINSDELSDNNFLAHATANMQDQTENDLGVGGGGGPPKLSLPTGPALYTPNVWVNDDMKRMRQRFTDGLFFQNFNAGLHSYYSKDWDHARQMFANILERFEDGPSRYFLDQIEKNRGKPPRNFHPYTIE